MTRDELLAELLIERYAHLERNLPPAYDEPAERRAWSNYTRSAATTLELARKYRARAAARARKRKGAA